MSKTAYTLTVDAEGLFICHGDITADRESDPGWRAVRAVAVDALQEQRLGYTVCRVCGHSTPDDREAKFHARDCPCAPASERIEGPDA